MNLRKCESIWSELDISIIKAGFETNKDSSSIFNSTGYLVEADYHLRGSLEIGEISHGYDVNSTDEETIEKKL